MTTETQTPEDWVLLEAARLSAFHEVPFTTLQSAYRAKSAYSALCDMIAKHEKPPVDRKVLCAQEAWRLHDEDLDSVTISVRAIELWEEGFGK
jgi:hypothetical protein